MGLIFPPAIVRSPNCPESSNSLEFSTSLSCGIHSSMDLFGRLTNLCLDFELLVSHRNPPVQCTRQSAGTCLATKSRALRDCLTASSASPRTSARWRGSPDIPHLYHWFRSRNRLRRPAWSAQLIRSKVRRPRHSPFQQTRQSASLRVCIRGKQWEWITAKPFPRETSKCQER